MNRIRRAAVLAQLAEEMAARGSWTGETHLQKAVYLLEELAKVPLGFEYVLYKHGPFSFQLREDLEAMRADDLVETIPRPYPYGPTIVPTSQSESLRERYPRTLGENKAALSWAANALAGKGVSELERLATAYYLITNEPGLKDDEARAQRLHQLKPHVGVAEATQALEEVRELVADASTRFG